MPQSYSFTCIIAQMPFITAAEKVTLTSCRHSPSRQQWQVTDPRMAKKRDFINTTSLKLPLWVCVGACWLIMGGTNTCMHTNTHVDMHTLIQTEWCVLVSPIILIVNTVAWYVQETCRTVSLSNQHLITFNACVWRTTKAWITLPGLPAHLQHRRGKRESETLDEVGFHLLFFLSL